MDLNQMAARVIARTIEPEPAESVAQRNGRTGGLKGGPARAAKLSTAQRSAQARKAAKARWTKQAATSAKRPPVVVERTRSAPTVPLDESLPRRDQPSL